MTNLTWTTTAPTKAGTYLVSYKGYRNKSRRIEVFNLKKPRKGSFFDGRVTLVYVQYDHHGTTEWEFKPQDLGGPVLWAGPIGKPDLKDLNPSK